jgi:hypothetical protein
LVLWAAAARPAPAETGLISFGFNTLVRPRPARRRFVRAKRARPPSVRLDALRPAQYRLAAFDAARRNFSMRRILVWALGLACLSAIPMGAADWITHSGDFQRTGWQKDETKISKDTVKNLQLLWKIKLETKQRSVYALYGPLIVERAITDRGFKEIAFVAGADNDLFAVDADLGKLLWKKHFAWHAEAPETEQASFLCPGGLTAWPVLQPLPQRGRGQNPRAAARPPRRHPPRPAPRRPRRRRSAAAGCSRFARSTRCRATAICTP